MAISKGGEILQIFMTYLKRIFLDFDGVMVTDYHYLILEKRHLKETDAFGVVFDPTSVDNLGRIIKVTGAELVITSSWKDWMSFQEIVRMFAAMYASVPQGIMNLSGGHQMPPDLDANR